MGTALNTLTFGEPLYLWLLLVPAGLALLWTGQVVRRTADIRRCVRERVVPVRGRYALAGDLAFWPFLIVAASLCIVALAQPQARISVVRKASTDIVILQDGSASMHVADVAPDRWQRSVQFIRAFADALGWRGDRVGLALFAHRAAPQLRLTRDPNTLFFFLDHLGAQPPFPLADDPTWDTNIEEAVRWGLELVEKDEQLFGKSNNPKAFVIISDGEAWSGHVAIALESARRRGIMVHVVGVGTTRGGIIPAGLDSVAADGAGAGARGSVIRSALDRDSLGAIARAGGGEYFELGRQSDREVASRIIDSVRRRAPTARQEDTREELYWRFLFAASILIALGTLFLKSAAELWWQAAGALTAALIVASVVG